MKPIVQRKRFIKLSKEFPAVYHDVLALGKQPFIMPFWQNVNSQIESEFLPKPPFNFLSIQAIKDTMFVQPSQEWVEAEASFLQKKLGNELARILREDSVGKPELFSKDGLKSSYNSLHHLYHIARFSAEQNLPIKKTKEIVEWGGGYGNMAKLWKRLDKEVTYTIIDTALFCSIQWLYLSSVLGPDQVNLLSRHNDSLKPGKINIVPLAMIDSAPTKCDVFISTWGLSESATAAQDYVLDNGWFGAKHLLIGFQNSTKDLKHASRLGKLAANDGAKIIDIKFIPNNHYAFK